jgi:hypothetical protein
MRRISLVTRVAGLAVAGLALAVDACRTVRPAGDAAPPRPDVLHVRVARQWIGVHEVTLRGDTLVVDHQPMMGSERPSVTRVVPGPEAWREFREAAERAGVRAWPRECRNPGIVDGGGFSLALAWGGTRVESSGVNAAPQRDGRCRTDGEYSDELRDLLAAVSRLIGRPFP